MANEYATDAQLIDRYPALAGQDADERAAVLEEVSRWIDGYCFRRFWIDEEVTVRVFAACDPYVLDLGGFEIGSASGVIVKDDDGTGTFATTVSSSDYQLEPVNAASASPEARPFSRIRRLAGRWPRATTRQSRQELVQVTALYGWPVAAPINVRSSCLMLTNNAFENPTGVRSEAIDGYSVTYQVGGRELGVPPTVVSLLGFYRRGWAA